MSEDRASNTKIIYVNLLNEGTPVLRPVYAVQMSSNIYKIIQPKDYNPDDEKWEFAPNTTVECKIEVRDGEKIFVAIRKIK